MHSLSTTTSRQGSLTGNFCLLDGRTSISAWAAVAALRLAALSISPGTRSRQISNRGKAAGRREQEPCEGAAECEDVAMAHSTRIAYPCVSPDSWWGGLCAFAWSRVTYWAWHFTCKIALDSYEKTIIILAIGKPNVPPVIAIRRGYRSDRTQQY